MGFGTHVLKHYAYSRIGEPAVLEKGKLLDKNLTCTATISPNGVEFTRFFIGGGTKNEYFAEYFDNLLVKMLDKYPGK